MDNNLLIVDPNDWGGDKNRGGVSLEDLNIFVELEVFSRDNDIKIFDNANLSAEVNTKAFKRGDRTVISFIDSDKSAKSFLTTNYTEVNTEFNKSNPDLDTLGIESIDITFNSSYTPMVKIKFKDVRGQLFEQGNDSPYSFLFKMPYPIFYLTIKGYYGKPVQYALHMIKFSGELDNETGSFIINCDFIGYTYAFLSDILMGYLKAIPHTVNGSKIIGNIENFITLDGFTRAIETLEKTTTAYKDNDKKLKALASLSDLYNKLDSLKTTLYKSISYVSANNGGFISNEANEIAFIPLIKSPKYQGYKPLNSLDSYEKDIRYLIEDFNELAKNANLDIKLTVDDFMLKGKTNSHYRELYAPDFSGTSDQYQSIDSYKYSNFLKRNNETSEQFDDREVFYNKFKSILESDSYEKALTDSYHINAPKIPVPIGNGFFFVRSPMSVFDLRKAVAQINDSQLKILEIRDNAKGLVSRDFVKVIEDSLKETDLTFTPTIEYLFKMLCNHVDLFIESIRMVGTEVKTKIIAGKNDRKLLPKLNESSSLPEYKKIDNNTQIRAFPQYIEKDDKNGGYVDKWFPPKLQHIDEVKFIDDLYESMIKQSKIETDFIESIKEVNDGWYPINPLDTKIVNKDNTNPWNLIEDSNKELVLKLFMERMVTFLGYSNSDLTEEEIKDMAMIEAEQANKAIKTPNVKASIGSVTVNSLISDVKDTSGISLSADSSNYVYQYAGLDSQNAQDPNGYNFLPISQSKKQLESKNNPVLLLDGWTKDSMLYGSTTVGGSDNQGEQFIKILKDYEYNTKLNYPPPTSTITTSNKGNITDSFTDNFTDVQNKMSNINYIYGGIVKTHEFTTYNSGSGDPYPLNIEFYGNSGLFTTGLRTNDAETTTSLFIFKDYNFKSKETRYDTFLTVENEYKLNENSDRLLTDSKEAEKAAIKQGNTSVTDLKSELVKFNQNTLDSRSYKFKYEPSFYSDGEQYSLFGSEFYYSQETDEAKAFLLLHSLPFDGLSKTNASELSSRDLLNTKIISIFNKRAGFVKAPYSWILFIGGLLYRMNQTKDIIKFTGGTGQSLIPNLNASTDLSLEKDNYLLSYFDSNLPTFHFDHYIKDKKGNFSTNKVTFNKVSNVIKNLPISVKSEFITEFTSWVNGDFKKLKNKLEIFASGTTPTERIDTWNNFNNAYNGGNILSPTLANNYIIVSKTNNKTNNNGNIYNFYLESRGGRTPINSEDTTGANDLIDFMLESRVILNSTYRIWGGSNTNPNNITIPKNSVTAYTHTFLTKFNELTSEKVNEPEIPLQKIFNSVNVDDIKLSLYKNIKSIYDKWIVGVDKDSESVIISKLFERFRFIDRAYNDIGSKFNINPMGLSDHLINSTNHSFYNFIAKILSANNFDFIPLPTFIDYSEETAVKEIFEPTRFSEMEPTSGPQFICMYIGERSNKLDFYDKNGDNINDGVIVDKDGNNTCLTDNSKDGKNKIPFFLVSYADQNQSVFKNIKVSQDEFTESNEGLQIIENLSKQNRNSSVGQNLFDIYENRSYSAEIEMLGCAQIQPFMYFQLNNIPMFRGAYTIIKTSHHITANHMTSKFKGVRIRCTKTKFIEKETLYYNLIENLDGVSSEGGDINDLSTTIINRAKTSNEDDRAIIDANDVDPNIAGTFSDPLNNMEITSQFGAIRDFAPDRPHQGVDYRALVPTPFYAVTEMKLVRIRYQKLVSGKVNGGLYLDFKVEGQDLWIRYMHLSELTHPIFDGLVLNEGDDITTSAQTKAIGYVFKQNELIGKTGSTGGAAPHLHFDIRTNKDVVSGVKYKKNPNLFFKSTTNKFSKTQNTGKSI